MVLSIFSFIILGIGIVFGIYLCSQFPDLPNFFKIKGRKKRPKRWHDDRYYDEYEERRPRRKPEPRQEVPPKRVPRRRPRKRYEEDELDWDDVYDP